MRKLFILFFFLLIAVFSFSQAKYDTLWKKVDRLNNGRGLPKSALESVNNIYQMAKKEKNEAQLLKALVTRSALETYFDEEGDGDIVMLRKEIAAAVGPSKYILHSLLGQAYNNRLSNHRYEIYGRTAIVSNPSQDVKTWSAQDFQLAIRKEFQASIQDEKMLQQISLEKYEAVLQKGNARFLRPTLYDLLANRAIDHFADEEPDATNPAYSFRVDKSTYFSPAEEFMKLTIKSSDSLSVHHIAFQILQKLLVFHRNDSRTDAFIDADIRRIELARQFATVSKKDELYRQALETIGNAYPNPPAAGRALLLIADYYVEKAEEFDSQNSEGEIIDSSGRLGYLEAEKICERILKQPGEIFSRSGAESILQTIRRKRLHIETELVNLPGMPFLGSVSFANLQSIYLRIVQADTTVSRALDRSDNGSWKSVLALKPIRSWQQKLPATSDHQMHRAEIKIDGLPAGSYFLIASASANFSEGELLAVQETAVSSIGIVQDGVNYFVVNRQSGQPLEKAKAQILFDGYDAKNRMRVWNRGPVLETDANGHFRFVNNDRNQRNGGIEITYKNDKLITENIVRPIYWSNDRATNDIDEERRDSRLYFFTDRSIYRPGQTVFFKALLIKNTKDKKAPELLTSRKTWIRLSDANGQTLDSVQVETNAYGSVKGSFVLPQGRLTGYFRMGSKDYEGEQSFSVEEYKRPKFNVEVEVPRGTYRLEDSVHLTGNARAFAGNNISNATVKFRVVRTQNFIFRSYSKRYPVGPELEILSGTVKTNDTGGFRISFKAISDEETDESYHYRITADVTDLNGETQSGQQMITVSRKALELRLSLGDKQNLPAANLKMIRVGTYNSGGIFQPAKFTIAFNPLEPPARLIRQRYWTRPDLFTMSRESFLADFPLDEYDKELDPEFWPVSGAAYTFTDSTKANEKINIDSSKISGGWYRVVATTHDRYGAEIRHIFHVQVIGESAPAAPAYVWHTEELENLKPGSIFKEKIGTSAKDLFVFEEIDRQKMEGYGEDTSASAYYIVRLNNEVKTKNISITEEDRGGFGINRFFVKDNRLFTTNTVVPVQWSNKRLDISFSTFRDKTLPGAEERWKIKITGEGKDQLAAEMLASMYDASLDEFRFHGWSQPNIWPTYYFSGRIDSYGFGKSDSRDRMETEKTVERKYPAYDGLYTAVVAQLERYKVEKLMGSIPGVAIERTSADLQEAVVVGYGTVAKRSVTGAVSVVTNAPPPPPPPPVKARTNLNETAFFFPDLHTDADGNIEFSFTMPEALTKWKLQLLAHTKDAKFGYAQKEVVTQKELMVQPNAMRFLREGDRLELSTKIANLSAKEITGIVQLELLDATTMNPVDGYYQNVNPKQYFTVAAGASAEASFPLQVPFQFGQALIYRITARSTSPNADFSDGEEAALPVLTNSILVTETMPLQLKTGETKTFNFDKLLKSGSSETLKQQGLTVEFTTNPSWYAVRALPYLAENSFQCSERIFNLFYANALAISIANSNPRIKAVIEKWKTAKPALSGTLQKNQELKAVLLEQTPWLLEGINDSIQQQNISNLFETALMDATQQSTVQMLAGYALSNGGFSWMLNGPDDRFITQYIVSGFGHLKKLGALKPDMENVIEPLLDGAIRYLDQRMQEDYNLLIKKKSALTANQLSYQISQYLYARSFFPEIAMKADTKKAYDYYLGQAAKFWINQNRMTQGMLALSLFRNKQNAPANAILKSLKQNAIHSEEMGSYWKDVRAGYFWYQAPVETQSMLIEAFSEISNDQPFADELRTWLLKQKQTQHWASTKATAEACYALLLKGTDWLTAEPNATIKLGNKTINNSNYEAGTGYFKEAIPGDAVLPSMGNIQVSVSAGSNAQTKTSGSPVWGAVYWQYFEKTEKITAAASAVQMTKKLYIERGSDRGPVLVPIQDGNEIKIGDKVRVRIELRADRDLEYVQLKDMRASGFEPLNVLSGYKWSGGLGYYEATGDASTNFFFDRLTKGTHVFEYSLFAAQKGNFSNGLTTIQCLYAPEFTSHSEGIRVNIEN